MKKRSGRTSFLTIILCIIIVVLAFLVIKMAFPKKSKGEFKQIKNYKELERIYENKNDSTNVLFTKLLTLPVSLLYCDFGNRYYTGPIGGEIINSFDGVSDSIAGIKGENASVGTNKNYSTTNIQVENVDEADVTKTDGEYIYSLSQDKIIITDVKDIQNAEIVSSFTMKNNAIVQELILFNNKLVAIGKTDTKNKANFGITYSYYRAVETTNIEIFDISDKASPKSIKMLEINEPYFTCRCINGNLYILSTGRLYKDSNDKIVTTYTEDNIIKNISFDNMYYMNDIKCSSQTIITGIDLDNLNENIDIKSYFIDLDNAYVSENNIYISDQSYEWDTSIPPIKSLFGLKGIFGAFDEKYYDYEYGEKTVIYKFDMNGTNINYMGKAEEDGKIVNQFSMDEYKDYLRVVTYDDDGTRINIYDNNMKKVGTSANLAKGEKMYSSRFIGEKAYLVTYKTVDPLFVVDLSDVKNPKVLGELKIPGYSTYLHPYDENHIIGIGMETKEVVQRDLDGKVIRTTAKIVGMKMALFDVTDVSSPKQISSVHIGDSMTTSAILTNHKALLFSKDKNILAIPVNNYSNDFEISNDIDNIDSAIKAYKSKSTNYIAEGYEVYNIDLENGFKKKGTITHKLDNENKAYSYKTLTHLLRGMYIDDNLYTISERMIKINKLDTLEQIKEIDISSYIED